MANKRSNPFFQFKQFTVWHDKCGMKVGTDGVLLGAWASVGDAKRILDIGTGTGLVALMLAQRASQRASITALEIDESAYEQAKENITRSPWQDLIEVFHQDFQSFRSLTKFDVIVSNPPYFMNSLASPDRQRNIARHNGSLTYHGLMKGVSQLLNKGGLFTVVIPTDAVAVLKGAAAEYNLYPIRLLNVITRSGGDPKRTLVSFSFVDKECVVEELLIESARHQYSEEYIRLTKDYYLYME